MKYNIDVSIIIPVWNAAGTIGALMNKLLTDTRAAIELIIVNDGSTDETSSVIRQIHDERVTFIELTHQGVYAARNAALAVHRG